MVKLLNFKIFEKNIIYKDFANDSEIEFVIQVFLANSECKVGIEWNRNWKEPIFVVERRGLMVWRRWKDARF